jgi:SAM-dependent methyltransferase
MNLITKVVLAASKKARQKRAEIFHKYFKIDASTKILDLGSEDGSNIASILAGTEYDAANVYIADIDNDLIQKGRENFGFTPILLDESGALPFSDVFFDIVYCSSVIEHITVPKESVWSRQINFAATAKHHQEQFAKEIVRVGKGYFVQTPARSFPIESHSWLPFIGYLSHQTQITVFKITNSFWVKKTIPDFRLLHKSEMAELFPNAEIVSEISFGLTKSLMAVKGL